MEIHIQYADLISSNLQPYNFKIGNKFKWITIMYIMINEVAMEIKTVGDKQICNMVGME